MKRPIIITGESHMGCMLNAINHLQPDFADRFDFVPLGGANLVPLEFFEHDATTGTVRITQQDWEKAQFPCRDENGAALENALYAVSMACNSGRFLRDYDWACYVPWHLRCSPHEIALSDALIGRIIVSDITSSLRFMTSLKQIGLDVCVVEAPRHFANAPHVEAMRGEVCDYLNATYLAYAKAQLRALNIPLIALPDQSIGKDGAMLPMYQCRNIGDTLHANMEFGIIMMQQILAFADRDGAWPWAD